MSKPNAHNGTESGSQDSEVAPPRRVLCDRVGLLIPFAKAGGTRPYNQSMNVLDFKESLIKTLASVPDDAALVLGSPIIIPVTRNGDAVGEIRIVATETSYYARKQG